MKYIRTKNNEIYKVSGEEELYWVVKDKEGITEWLIPKCNVIKQVDTIEELCDEFVIIDKSKPFRPELDYTPCSYRDKNIKKYGAIWTNKGLIYVAKLNEKGEFELL